MKNKTLKKQENMKLKITIFSILLPILSFAQFSERSIAQKTSSELVKYDSTENFKHHRNLSDYRMYIGEEFYILPSNFKNYVSLEESNRFNNMTYITPRTMIKLDRTKKKAKPILSYKYHYKSDSTDMITPYDSIGGKTFKVIGFDETKSKKNSELSNQLYFILVEKNDNDTVIWTPTIYEFQYPFSIAIVSYLQMIKKKYVNQDFYSKSNMVGRAETPYFPPYFGHLVNIANGEAVTVNELEVLKCVDLAIIGVYSKSFKMPMLVFRNTKGEEFPVFFIRERKENPSRPSVDDDFIMFDEYNSLCKTFGDEFGRLIALNKVKIGMSSSMCLLSWGTPKDINKTIVNNSVHEQWVYGGNRYLYFENKILTSIQN